MLVNNRDGVNSFAFGRQGARGGVCQVVGFFDVAAARLCAGDGPIAALVVGSSCSINSAL